MQGTMICMPERVHDGSGTLTATLNPKPYQGLFVDLP